MRPSPWFQDGIAFVLAGLVAWSVMQLAGPWDLPLAPLAALGVVVAAGLVVWRLRERALPPGGTPPFPVHLGRRATAVSLAAVLAVALALRIHGLSRLPAWEDEMWTLRNFYTEDWGLLLRIAFDDYWPPLHYLVLNTVSRVFDTSLLAMRSPSVLFGTAAVAAMYPIGRRLFASRLAGLMAAALLGGMTAHVLYSQEARVYSMQILFVILSALYFFEGWRERRISPAFIVVTTLLTYSHSFASWYFIAGQWAFLGVAWLVWRDGEALRKGLLAQGIVLLLWTPLVAAFAYSRLARAIEVPTEWATGADQASMLFEFVETYQALAVRSWAGAALLVVLFVLAALPLASRLWRRLDPGAEPDEGTRDYRVVLTFLLCWTSVPILFSWAVSVVTSLDTFGSTRYHLTVLPGLCLLAVAGLRQVRSRAGLGAAVLLVLLLPTAQLVRHYQDFGRDRPAVEEAAAIVRAHGDRDENIYIAHSFRSFAYYHRGVFPRIGSPRWDSLVEAHAEYTDLYTMPTGKLGDTYAHEKFTPRIRYVGQYGEERVGEFLAEERTRGGFDRSYWLIFRGEKSLFRSAWAEAGIPCLEPRRWRVNGLLLLRCGASRHGTSRPELTLGG